MDIKKKSMSKKSNKKCPRMSKKKNLIDATKKCDAIRNNDKEPIFYIILTYMH